LASRLHSSLLRQYPGSNITNVLFRYISNNFLTELFPNSRWAEKDDRKPSAGRDGWKRYHTPMTSPPEFSLLPVASWAHSVLSMADHPWH
jgi:hypothetical protein